MAREKHTFCRLLQLLLKLKLEVSYKWCERAGDRHCSSAAQAGTEDLGLSLAGTPGYVGTALANSRQDVYICSARLL